MALRFLLQARQALNNLENYIGILLGRRYPPDAYCIASVDSVPSKTTNTSETFSTENLMKDAILWAVPKTRRTIEKRLKRKFGLKERVWKMLGPKKNLMMCNTCGTHHEAGFLCPACYDKVQKETKQMQDTIQAELGLNPVEKEVIVLYEGEKEGYTEEFFEGKRIVEMKKERPPWFSKNLLQKSTAQPSTSKDVKPTELA